MCGAAKSKDENGNDAEDLGLSILDIVKFSTLVVSQSLSDTDKLSIVTYSDDATTVLKPTLMTSEGKETVKKVLENMKPVFRTNLFAGLEKGVKQAHQVGNNYLSSIFILTDGVPNIHPPNSYEEDITKLLAATPVFGSISTFGFGYSLDSKLLVDIATMGGGYYSFIPDAGMVGTCFINALANSRCAYGMQPVLKITGWDAGALTEVGMILPAKGGKARKVVTPVTVDERYETSVDDKGTGIYVKLPPLRYGSNVDVVLKPQLFRGAGDITMELQFSTVGGGVMYLPIQNAGSDPAEELFHSTRVQFVKDAFFMSFDAYRDSESSLNTFLTPTLTTPTSTLDPNLTALHQDMKGQATEAIADAYSFATWGKHYLLSLSTAHLHQFCNNFKDPGVQIYGKGLLFNSLQDSLDDIFESVPPPVPSRRRAVVSGGGGGAAPKMSQVFNNQNAVCVHGETKVTVQSPDKQVTASIDIHEVKKGDLILTANGTYVKVECLVETRVDDQLQDNRPFDLLKIGNLRVTPYHPIKVTPQSDWSFPIQATTNRPHVTSTAYSVYNLVLERGQRHHAVLMDGIESITLGHGITNNAVLQHDYFGTNKVVEDLQQVNGWMEGRVILKESDVKRDVNSGCINRIADGVGGVEEVAVGNSVQLCALPCVA